MGVDAAELACEVSGRTRAPPAESAVAVLAEAAAILVRVEVSVEELVMSSGGDTELRFSRSTLACQA